MTGERAHNYLYVLKISNIIGETNAVVNQEVANTSLWLKRLSYISEIGLNELCKQDLFGDDKLGSLEFNKYCVYGKQTKVKFFIGIHMTKDKVGYIHLCLRGPTRIPTHEGFCGDLGSNTGALRDKGRTLGEEGDS
ncbi:uncharacterized mitochondrial protein AtMg00300-like [Cicer arietinum]|uniref:uncharacterized mitochondrial protein AtMg00300-like n=1 Tax=Cicer arietinum TaxID=3827 RepID=UPI00032ABB7D